ncbi:hypothetical protein [Ensifer soli]|uniref:hypothetical protein n=1 Tax=Ciceribacter sp. sgz301302 TaxID=3342379 RepID=UPI0035BA5A2E
MAHYADRTHEAERNEFSAKEARQGRPGIPVLRILIASLVLVAIAWAGAAMWGESIDNDPATQVQQVAPPADTTTPGNATVEGTVPGTTTDARPQSGTGGESQQTAPVAPAQ